MQYIGDGSVRSEEQASQAIDRFEAEWDERGFGLFALELKDGGAFIGFTGLSQPDFMPELLPAVEIGWRLAPTHWGMGYATEAARAALDFGIRLPNAPDIVSVCQAGNDASARIMQKIGLAFDRRSVDPTCGREVTVYRLPG
jgi:RimJ/RimL family protein N-acetyltransferase